MIFPWNVNLNPFRSIYWNLIGYPWINQWYLSSNLRPLAAALNTSLSTPLLASCAQQSRIRAMTVTLAPNPVPTAMSGPELLKDATWLESWALSNALSELATPRLCSPGLVQDHGSSLYGMMVWVKISLRTKLYWSYLGMEHVWLVTTCAWCRQDSCTLQVALNHATGITPSNARN